MSGQPIKDLEWCFNMEPHIVALPHLLGAKWLLLMALDTDPIDRNLVLRATAKVEDVRQLIDPTAGFSIEIEDDK